MTATPTDVGRGAFLNLAFSDLDDDKNVTVEQLKLMAVDTERSLDEAYANWSKYSDTLTRNRELLHGRIEQRKQEVLNMINEHAQSLHEKLEASVESQLELGSGTLQFLSSSLQRTQAISQGINSENNADVDKQDIFLDMQEIREGINNNVPIWLPLALKHAGPVDYLATHLFGTLQVVDKELYPLRLAERVDLVRSFSIKTKWDEMPCAIVDMAVTEDQEVLVCDKNNKLLKVFDKNGQFKMLMGHGQVKDPTRVISLRHTNSVLVTDNAMRRVKMYHKNGTFVCDFICDIKYPTSLCENYKGDIVVVEFDSRSILVYSPEGQVVHSFKSSLPNPTHIACTPGGDVIVTDWRNHAVRTFHVDGDLAWRFRDRGAGDAQMEQPQGISVDPLGHVIVADTSNHRLQVFDLEGRHQRVLIPKGGHGLKLPMVVDTSSSGELYVGEYQGGVKVFKYLDRVDVALPHQHLDMGSSCDTEGEEEKLENGVLEGYVKLEEVSLADDEDETSM